MGPQGSTEFSPHPACLLLRVLPGRPGRLGLCAGFQQSMPCPGTGWKSRSAQCVPSFTQICNSSIASGLLCHWFILSAGSFPELSSNCRVQLRHLGWLSVVSSRVEKPLVGNPSIRGTKVLLLLKGNIGSCGAGDVSGSHLPREKQGAAVFGWPCPVWARSGAPLFSASHRVFGSCSEPP